MNKKFLFLGVIEAGGVKMKSTLSDPINADRLINKVSIMIRQCPGNLFGFPLGTPFAKEH